MMKYHRFIAMVVSLFLLQAISSVMAEDEKTIVTAGPSWDRFTNEDGSGLYHDIIKQVFAGYAVKHFYVPTVQANSMVAIGRADIKMCETKEIEHLVLASLPMYENDFYALYLREKFEPWEGDLTIKGQRLVWREGYYSKIDFAVPIDFTEVRSGESALKMVIYDRADFYIDDLNLINQSFVNAGEKYDPAKFGLEIVGTRKYFPVFADTPRGHKLRNHYEKEIERLYREGALQQVYTHWNFRMPKFEFGVSGK
ncbi:type 2 periplasmic-binding domain-containing protein [Desulfopila aestuarii]|nr:transporter substrate-binding domain-containing protein [Desulfopila aestuarii]